MDWKRYLEIKARKSRSEPQFWPENQQEAKKALALGIIDIEQYIEFSLSQEPLLDVVHDPDPDVRKEAIRKIAERRMPFSIRTLREMLLDRDEEVRLYAASELERLEGDMHRKMYKLQRALELQPEQPHLKFELARSYVEYAYLFLESEPLRRFFLQKAIFLLDQIIRQHPDEYEYHFFRGIAWKLQKRYAQAMEDFKKCMLLNPENARAYFQMAELYFLAGRFDLVEKIFKKIPYKGLNEHETDVVSFWLEDHLPVDLLAGSWTA
jgi:tetratricopeptide (TPR) repeat protein